MGRRHGEVARPGRRGVRELHVADDVAAAYPGVVLERLREVKRTYDPDNVFRYNHNVTPAPAGPAG
ncbi:BBE domain-containing protein [Georgenia satyanarayanai]|uniref:BBE domain-containing protein n=1 Tax=Georgenia satyanarayanai TaxID=860221 RepID=UPI001D00951B